ncbi:hypothetical protein I0C86_15310 [Plantactinospora sp. S1510]|uniref:Uncharacterized protein n=1 Tax=Plantactinospora alkalitolerans TaxID=2789879 RepID=A0ABS0GWF1_9ACTN|nr:hypothetical protein [Plantactinospora alkalitolerans]MBF9130313.1 hypothetical protein [Plantactinospora alkalitolerans]
MTEAGSEMLRVVLDLVPDAEPIQGQAHGADGIEHAFAGWLELVEVLDRARSSQPPCPFGRPTATDRESP